MFTVDVYVHFRRQDVRFACDTFHKCRCFNILRCTFAWKWEGREEYRRTDFAYIATGECQGKKDEGATRAGWEEKTPAPYTGTAMNTYVCIDLPDPGDSIRRRDDASHGIMRPRREQMIDTSNVVENSPEVVHPPVAARPLAARPRKYLHGVVTRDLR